MTSLQTSAGTHIQARLLRSLPEYHVIPEHDPSILSSSFSYLTRPCSAFAFEEYVFPFRSPEKFRASKVDKLKGGTGKMLLFSD